MPISVKSYECCPVVVGWCLMLCHTQCNHSQKRCYFVVSFMTGEGVKEITPDYNMTGFEGEMLNHLKCNACEHMPPSSICQPLEHLWEISPIIGCEKEHLNCQSRSQIPYEYVLLHWNIFTGFKTHRYLRCEVARHTHNCPWRQAFWGDNSRR